jgi:hypothetical protein
MSIDMNVDNDGYNVGEREMLTPDLVIVDDDDDGYNVGEREILKPDLVIVDDDDDDDDVVYIPIPIGIDDIPPSSLPTTMMWKGLKFTAKSRERDLKNKSAYVISINIVHSHVHSFHLRRFVEGSVPLFHISVRQRQKL